MKMRDRRRNLANSPNRAAKARVVSLRARARARRRSTFLSSMLYASVIKPSGAVRISTIA